VPSFTRTCALSAPAQLVWERVTTPEGINEEFWPRFRMTVPKQAVGLDISTVEVPAHLGRSWFFAQGLPVAVDDITIVELGPGYRFVEQSKMTALKVWRHERVVTPTDAGCTVADTITFEAKLRPLNWMLGKLLPRLFWYRHAHLETRFGNRPI
jgi:hypothetical protein